MKYYKIEVYDRFKNKIYVDRGFKSYLEAYEEIIFMKENAMIYNASRYLIKEY